MTFFCPVQNARVATLVMADETWAVIAHPFMPPLAVNLNDGRTEEIAPIEQYMHALHRSMGRRR